MMLNLMQHGPVGTEGEWDTNTEDTSGDEQDFSKLWEDVGGEG